MIEIKQVGNQWRIKEDDNVHYYRDIDKVYLHILKAKVNAHGVISCSSLLVYEDKNPDDVRKIKIIKQGATYMDMVVPEETALDTMYTVNDKIFTRRA